MKASLSDALGIGGSNEEMELLTRRIDTLNAKMMKLINDAVSEGRSIDDNEGEFKEISDEIAQLNSRVSAIKELIANDESAKDRLAERCQVSISYAIGKAEPIAVSVDSFGSSSYSDEKLTEIVTKIFDLRPAAIIDQFDLTKPIFKKTSAYGHFNSPDFPWEKTDAVPELVKVAK